ncbi:MAG: hypothetical protein ACKV1O_00920 [Saprospiraceae bacterium]
MNEFFKEILPIGVVLTFVVTIINIYYTRRNLKTTKYIDTITSERIKWLDVIRNEVTNIIANIHFTLKIYSDDIQDRENEISNYEDSVEAQIEAQSTYFDTPTSFALGQKKEIWSQSDFIKYLFVFKLRLNPEEDKGIIEIVDYFIKFYSESEYKSEGEIPEARENIKKLITQTQSLLKQEWEKIKKESKGKL